MGETQGGPEDGLLFTDRAARNALAFRKGASCSSREESFRRGDRAAAEASACARQKMEFLEQQLHVLAALLQESVEGIDRSDDSASSHSGDLAQTRASP